MRIITYLIAFLLAWPAFADPEPVKVVAVVGDQVISSVDLDERVHLIMATTGIPDTPEARAKLAPQILRQLIDEKLQTQDAAANGITVTDDQVKSAIAQIEKQNNQPPGSLEPMLEARGASKASFYAQLRAQVAWTDIISKKIRPRIRVSDQEIARYVAHKTSVEATAGSGGKEVMIEVIQLPVDSPKNEASVHKVAEKLADEIHSGVSFEKIAMQFSPGAGGAAVEPFWVEVAQLDPAIGAALSGVVKGGVTQPVKTGNGYQIVKLVDIKDKSAPAKEPVASAPAAPAPRVEYAFRQIIVADRPDSKNKDDKKLLALADTIAKAPGRCTDKAAPVAAGADADITASLIRRQGSDLPDKVREILAGLTVGGVSQPVVTPDGVRLFMLCERVDMPPEKPSEEASRPSDEAIRQKIFMEKLELEVQKYMRNLREQGFIEVRGL